MEIDKNKGQVIIGVCLAFSGWIAAETYSQAQRLASLEEAKAAHERIDLELQQLRASVQTLLHPR